MAYGLDPTSWGLLICVGCAAGFLAGIGIGGAFVVVPALITILPHLGVAASDTAKIAAATSLALNIPNNIASAQVYQQKASIDWRFTALLTPGIVVGAIVAATFANFIDVRVITLLFVAVAMRSAFQLLTENKSKTSPHRHIKDINVIGMTLKTVAGGFTSTLLGLGVAFFCVPILSRFGSLSKAIGTTSVLVLPMAVAGIVTHLLTNPSSGCGSTCAGYIFLPAVAAIGLASVLTAPLGAMAAHVLPMRALQRMFAITLIATAGHIAMKTLAPEALMHDAKTLAAEMIVKPWRGESAMPATPFFESRPGEKLQAQMHSGSR